jgi:hypothetical protein
MNDLTILFLTANKVPKSWAEYHKNILLEAASGQPIITISREPLDWGTNILQEREYGTDNVIWSILQGAKLATTKYIGIAEDDCLYSREHFLYRPREKNVAYNYSCWQLQTWLPIYYLRWRLAMHSMIALRETTIDAFEERYERYPNVLPHHLTGEIGRNDVEYRRFFVNEFEIFYTSVGIVHLQHPYSIDPLEQKQKKKVGLIRAYDIPHWGKACELVKKFQ